MFWVPAQAAIRVIPAVAGVVSFDSWGQATFQQPMQVFGVVPTFGPDASDTMYNFGGFAQGIAGMLVGGGAAINGSTGARPKRQPRRQQARALAPDDWQENEVTQQSHNFASVPTSPTAAAPQESTQDLGEMNKLMFQLKEGGEPRRAALAVISGSVWDLSLDPVGCRVIQLALDVANQKDGAELASEFLGHVRAAIESKHANYVVQKILEVLPTSMASFVVEELKGFAVEVSQHRYGCRILCRLLEHSATEGATAELVTEILLDARNLSRHTYGYHVVRCILEHGLPEHRLRIATALSAGAQRHAKHRHASFIIEKAFAHCDDQAREGLAYELLQRPENILDLARHQFGRHVVSQLVRGHGACSQQALQNLRAGMAQVQTSKHGRRLIQELRPQLMCNPASA